MAISLRASGSWAAANATTQTVTLPTHAAGDMLLVRVAFKHATMPTTVTCDTAGWTKIGQYNNGTTASGNGTGSVIVAVFYKVATSAAETNPVITYHASVAATPSAAVALSYQKGADEGWVAPVGAGGPVGTTTSISSTITSHISTTAGDMVDFFLSQGDNNTLTVPTFTQTGLTLGTVSEQPAAALSDATSNDIDADGGYRLVSSGTSSAAAVVTATATAGDQGSAWTTRLRVVKAITVPFLDGAPALYAPTIIPDQLITVPLLEQVAGFTRGTLVAADDFNEINVSDWGNADTGGTWLESGSSNASYEKIPPGAIYSTTATTHYGGQYLPVSAADVEYLVQMSLTGLGATGDLQGIGFRRGTNKYVAALVYISTTQLRLDLRYGASTSSLEILSSIANSGNVTVTDPNGTYWIHGWAVGTSHKIRFWKQGDNEPETFQIDITDSSSTAAGGVELCDAIGWNSSTVYDEFSVWNSSLGSAAPVLYAPTVAHAGVSAQTLTLGLLDAASALYAPTLVRDEFITVPLLDATAALYAPTLVGKNTITLGLLDAAAALYQPQVTAKNLISLGLLDASSALYSPTLTVGPVSITLSLLDAAADLYAPVIAQSGGTQSISLALLDAVADLYAPSVTSRVTLTIPLLDGSAALYAPTIMRDQFLTVPLLDAGSAIYPPTLSAKNTLTLGLLDNGSALYAPTLIQDQFVTLPLLDAVADLYPPIISSGAIFLPLLDAAAALYPPTLIQDQFVTLGLIDAAAALYAPTLTKRNTLTIPHLDAAAALYAPTLRGKNTLSLTLLDAGAALYAPTVQPGAVSLTLALLDASAALYAPVITDAGVTIRLVLLDGAAELYAPVIEGGLQLDDITLGVVLQEFWPRKRKVRDHRIL